jgi:hypothetical protein
MDGGIVLYELHVIHNTYFTVTVGMKGCVHFKGLKHKSELAVNTRPPSMKWDMAGHAE